MDIQMDKIYKAHKYYIIGMVLVCLAGYALITCGSLLFKLTDDFPAVTLAVALVILMVYNVISAVLYLRIVKTHQNSLVHFYLVNKAVRMIFAFAAILCAIFFLEKGVISFVIGFFALYVLTIIYESVFFVQVEKKLNETK
jgi:hypothetical protein